MDENKFRRDLARIKNRVKLQEKLRKPALVSIYLLIFTSICSCIILCGFLIYGWQYDISSQQIIRVGLVKYESTPNGASVNFDDENTTHSTNNQSTLQIGDHKIKVWLDGYRDWQNVFNLHEQQVLSYNYLLLIPQNITTNKVALDSFKTDAQKLSPDNSKIITPTDKTGSFIFTDISDPEKPKATSFDLLNNAITKPKNLASETITALKWDKSGNFVLFNHKYDDKEEFLVWSKDKPNEARNITSNFSVNISGIAFNDINSENQFYVIDQNRDLRLLNYANKTISAPVESGVVSFSQYDNKITAIYERDNKLCVSVNYDNGKKYIANEWQDKTAATFPVFAQFSKYYNTERLVISYGNTVELITDPLTKSDESKIYSFETTAPTARLSLNEEGRLVLVENANGLELYDIERDLHFSYTLGNKLGDFAWLDNYHLTFHTTKNEVLIVDFDGTNYQNITVGSSNGFISKDKKYLFSFVGNADNPAKSSLQYSNLQIK